MSDLTTTLTKSDLAERLQLSTRSIDRRRAAGDLLAPLGGSGHPRWSAVEVTSWIAAGCPRADVWARLNRRRA